MMEIEAGSTTNEPLMLALKQAIEKAVIALVLEGVRARRWQFENAGLGDVWMERHCAGKHRAEFMNEEQFQALLKGQENGQMAQATSPRRVARRRRNQLTGDGDSPRGTFAPTGSVARKPIEVLT